MMKTGIPLLMAILFLLPVLSGCTTIRSEQTAPLPLEMTSWNLISYVDMDGNMVDRVQETAVTAVFSDGGIAGNAGCNNYFGSYEATGDAIIIGPIGSTQMYCEGTGLMEQETAYVTDLSNVKYYSITGSQLTLSDETGNPILIYSGSAT